MIIWQGLGFLAILIPMLLVAALQILLGNSTSGLLAYYMEIALLISAALVWFVGKKVNGGAAKELIDPETQQKVVLKKTHTIFWIPMQWFAIALVALAIWMFIAPQFGG